MTTKKHTSTFGVCKNIRGMYYLVIDGKGHHSLSYSNKEFALKKAGQYARRLHQTFTDGRGITHTWKFENIGEVKELNYTKETARAETHYIPVEMDFVVNQ